MRKFINLITNPATKTLVESRHLTPELKKQRDRVKKALDREHPDWPEGKVYAIATTAAEKTVKEEAEPSVMDEKEIRAYRAGVNCYKRCVGSHTYGLGHQPENIEKAFNKGYSDAKAENIVEQRGEETYPCIKRIKGGWEVSTSPSHHKLFKNIQDDAEKKAKEYFDSLSSTKLDEEITKVDESKEAGYITIAKCTVTGKNGDSEGDYWSAAFFKKKPSGKGVEHADEVLVQSDSRAGKSRETALAAAKKKRPDAIVIESKGDLEENTLSARAGRHGKDLGKQGKNFKKIEDKAAKEYGSKEAGERVAGAILAKMREHVKEAFGTAGIVSYSANNTTDHQPKDW